jgi:hypothetical protein
MATADIEIVRWEWGRRVEAEYRSAALTQHLSLWLIQIGASPDLITAGLQIVVDELNHARMAHEVLIEAGGEAIGPIDRDSLQLERDEEVTLEVDVLRTAVEVFCLGETVAVRLFNRLRSGCVVPVARRALDCVLQDEVRHRDFGWLLLDWMLNTPPAAEDRQIMSDELPGMLSRVYASYAPSADLALTEMSDDIRAWGLMPLSDYIEAVDETVRRDYTPRFVERRVDVGLPSPTGQ